VSENPPVDPGINPAASRWIFLVLVAMLLAAGGIVLSAGRSTPPPPDVAKDPTLVTGREIYLSRCISCHGEKGRGDGPLAKSLTGPRPRDFLNEEWKYGDRPEKALNVVAKGVPGTAMGGWESSYSRPELKAVTAYVYYLAGKPIPDVLR
jgi:cytochrome c oxidase cbb3-type subunit 3